MLTLTPIRRRALRTLAHAITPVVRIGEMGLSENVVHELDQALRSHELIKIKVFGDERKTRDALLEEICRRLEAAPVQHVGKILVIYRPRPDQIAAPAPFRKRKESRRTKRSFQN